MKPSPLIGRIALAAGAVAVLARRPPDPGAVARALRSPDSVDGVVAALAGALLWAMAAWLLLVLSAAAAARLPGGAGRAARSLARAVVPRAWRGVLVGTLASGLVLGPAVAASAQGSGAGTGAGTARSGVTSIATPPPTWPTTPAPGWPTSPSDAAPPPTTAAPPAATAPTAAPPPTVPERTSDGAVRVRPGDSLWSIAAAHLDPPDPGAADPGATARTAAAWPRWFAVNRDVLGDDPDLIHPGVALRPPADTGGRP